MNNRRAPISTLISIISAITIVGFTILGLLLAVTYGIAESQTRNVNVIAVIFGMILRLGIVFLVGLPISALLAGFAKIVAWYEAVPPGQVCIIQTPDGGSAAVTPAPGASAPAPAAPARPVAPAPAAPRPSRSPAPAPAAPQPPHTENRNWSEVPQSPAPVPAKPVPAMPQYTDERDRSAVPVAHNEGPGRVPVAHDEGPGRVPVAAVPYGRWKCPTCGDIQPSYFKTCRHCSTPNPNDVTPSAAPKPARVKRNPYVPTWLCTCGAENPVSRGTCDSCGGAKPFPQARR